MDTPNKLNIICSNCDEYVDIHDIFKVDHDIVCHSCYEDMLEDAQ